jgi:threonine synthase
VSKSEVAYQQCINPDCNATFGVDEVIFSCPKCGELLDIRYNWDKAQVPKSLKYFEQKWNTKASIYDFSGVWRFRELLPFADIKDIVTVGEGRTMLQRADLLADHIGHKRGQLFLQYEGMNPSGSFKDNGMTAAFTLARKLGKKRVACASTGNTSASLAMYAALSGSMQGIVFIGSGKIAYGKLSQALEYGALTLQVHGDFDACLKQVRLASDRLGLYLMNSVNPFRLEGQKTIMYRILEARDWEVPDWIVVPGGNMGNCSAFGKAFMELYELGLIKKVPSIAIINAAGANTLYDLVEHRACDGTRAASIRRRSKLITKIWTMKIFTPIRLPARLKSVGR